MKDIVYIVGDFSKWDDNELRCSLRSLDRYGKNYGNVFISGYKADWVSDKVFHVKQEDIYFKNKNIMLKILAACNDERVSGDFIYICDDHFLYDNVDFNEYGVYCDTKDIESLLWGMGIKRRQSWWWYKVMANTLNQLKSKKLPVLNYDMHLPFVVSKGEFINTVENFNWDDPENKGLAWKSVYGNFNRIPCRNTGDNKFKNEDEVKAFFRSTRNNKPPGIFSIEPKINDDMKSFVLSLYPDKCRFEK